MKPPCCLNVAYYNLGQSRSSNEMGVATAVMTSKGQLTIPVDVRRRMGLDSGDRVEFVELESGRFAIKPAVDDVRSLKGLLRKPGRPVAIADMDKAIRERAVRGQDR